MWLPATAGPQGLLAPVDEALVDGLAVEVGASVRHLPD
jgi:hypothetical protein